MMSDELDNIIWNGQFEMVKMGLILKNCDTVLEIWRLDISDHAPLKSTY